ncbi:hypothetical protein [Anaerorhabdus sp.]|uniref:hypothetical protein n=1 Tax=Anaerorhabdus sp. TaxID=1872524 RepID=UPI002FC5E16D
MDFRYFYFSVHDDPVLLKFKRYQNQERMTLNEAFLKHELLCNEESDNLESYHPVIGCCFFTDFKNKSELKMKVYIPLYTWTTAPELEEEWIDYLEGKGLNIRNNAVYKDAKKAYLEFLSKGEINWYGMHFKIR